VIVVGDQRSAQFKEVSMGSSLQRLEVVLIALVVLIAGAVAAILLFVRPPSSLTYVVVTPQPVATRVQAHPTSVSTQIPTVAPTIVSPLVAPIAPQPTAAPLPRAVAWPVLTVPPILTASWPWLLLAVGIGGGSLVALRMRRRRMPYTNQTIGQLLAVADTTTREANRRVMRVLAEQGVLTSELARGAGIDLGQPQPQSASHLSRLVWPLPSRSRLQRLRSHLPAIRMPAIHLPQRLTFSRQRPPINDLLPATPSAASPTIDSNDASPESPQVPSALMSPSEVVPSVDDEGIEHSKLAYYTPRATDERTEVWTAEDRVLAVAQLLADVWAAAGIGRTLPLQSAVVALDTERTSGNGLVIVTIDLHPDETELIGDSIDRAIASHPSWRATWRQQVLEIMMTVEGRQPPLGGPLLAPVLTHGRGNKTTRFFPLATWRHLGLYGANALHALHALLGSLLYTQPPAKLALAIIDQGEVSPLYRDVAHQIALPGSPRQTLELLAQAMRQTTPHHVRPLVLVLVEPDDALLHMLWGMLTRMQARPAVPVHLIVVQERPCRAGHELYALLPALISSGGEGSATLLPGQGDWPKRGEARLVGRGLRVEGRAIVLDEAAIAAMVTQLRGEPVDALPVIWDAPMDDLPTPILAELEACQADDGAASIAGETSDDQCLASNSDVIADRERQVAQAIVAHRQRLIDTDLPSPSWQAMHAPCADLPLPSADESVQLNQGIRAELDVSPAGVDPTEPPASTIEPKMVPVVDQVVPIVEPPTLPTLPIDAIEAHQLTADVAPVQRIVAVVTEPASRADMAEASALSEGNPPAELAPSRLASLLRSAHDAGQADAPPFQVSLLRTSEPRPSDVQQASDLSMVHDRSTPPPTIEPDNGWPIGPTPLGRVALAELMARVVTTPAIIAGQPNEVGVTKNRLAELLKGTHKAQARDLAEILLVWLDLSSLLVAPTRPGRLRHPRALTTTDLAEIAARLNATPCPAAETVNAMWSEAVEGRP
jgi:hypothetical protein